LAEFSTNNGASEMAKYTPIFAVQWVDPYQQYVVLEMVQGYLAMVWAATGTDTLVRVRNCQGIKPGN